MQQAANIEVQFVTGFGPIVRDDVASRKLYRDTLHIAFKEEKGGYLHTEALEGVRTFALWPLGQAAQSCFGKGAWPEKIPAPQSWLELDVRNLEAATAELEAREYRVLVKNRREPWGQVVSRFLSPEGMLVGLAVTPALRKPRQQRATGRTTVTTYEPKVFDEVTGSARLTDLHVSERFSGDIEGDGVVHVVQAAHPDGSASFAGIERVRGSIGGKKGSFLLQVQGTVVKKQMEATWSVVRGSGTGDLQGLRGDGGFKAELGQHGSIWLDYDLEDTA